MCIFYFHKRISNLFKHQVPASHQTWALLLLCYSPLTWWRDCGESCDISSASSLPEEVLAENEGQRRGGGTREARFCMAARLHGGDASVAVLTFCSEGPGYQHWPLGPNSSHVRAQMEDGKHPCTEPGLCSNSGNGCRHTLLPRCTLALLWISLGCFNTTRLTLSY